MKYKNSSTDFLRDCANKSVISDLYLDSLKFAHCVGALKTKTMDDGYIQIYKYIRIQINMGIGIG